MDEHPAHSSCYRSGGSIGDEAAGRKEARDADLDSPAHRVPGIEEERTCGAWGRGVEAQFLSPARRTTGLRHRETPPHSHEPLSGSDPSSPPSCRGWGGSRSFPGKVGCGARRAGEGTGQRIVALGAVLLLAWADITCSAAVAVDTRGGGGGIGASLCAAGEGEVAELSASSSPFPPFAGAREYHTAAPFAHWDASSGAFIQGALVYGGRNASHTALSDAFLLTLPPGAAGTNAAGAGAPAIVALSTVAGVAPALFGHVAAWTGAVTLKPSRLNPLHNVALKINPQHRALQTLNPKT